MPAIDHVVHVCPSVRNEPSPTPHPPDSRPPDGELGLDKLNTYAAKLAGISWSEHVIRILLERNEAYKQRYPTSSPTKRICWPLNPVQTTALQTALYFLQQHADTLSPPPLSRYPCDESTQIASE
ncbi:hypothetical protein [Dyella flagellata]|uniref:Uncharacterized protein n=1 Tax=Dyella flagellata TaxID=1867833 RepID=A0ABQ5X5B7_9GAMM|nr:hypothetical protein [Dyella flagellata]GLQ86786.1 hypothetical protein GCM10007898_03520 [Dyella flagellata]